jgi:hypothetical protein
MSLEEKQRLAVQAAEEFWKSDIIDPSSKDHSEKALHSLKFIDSIIRSKAGLNWTWEKEYKGDGDFQWCGAFVAACYAKAGLQLKYREKNFASTYRLDRWPQGISESADRDRQVTMDDSKVRAYCKCESVEAIKAFKPRAGDIVLVGQSGYGTHITLLTEFDDDIFYTVEGNAFGDGPTDKKQEGVIKRMRKISDARRIIRPALADFE